jgi:hypothetical protein
VVGGDVEGDGRDNKGGDKQMGARCRESSEMNGEDGGSGDITKGVAGDHR